MDCHFKKDPSLGAELYAYLLITQPSPGRARTTVLLLMQTNITNQQ